MKHLIRTAAMICAILTGGQKQAQAQTQKISIMNEVTFYDGYQMENNPDKDLDDGILRHSCSLAAVRLSDSQIEAMGNSLLLMNAYIKACCDNYDRIGNINIALVPKGSDTYSTKDVQRIEIARFITPFMDKNKQPDTVPYSYWIDYLGPILNDKSLRVRFDFWMELEIFGMPYSARNEIAGCADRSDVFKATLEFETIGDPIGPTDGNMLVPIVIKRPEYIGNNLNNYNPEATDTLRKTVKTYVFEVPEDVTEAQVVLITSNHGANANGEEYNRRWHYVYFNDKPVLNYLPGRKSCEPFRKYNTQLNGIYGYSAMTDAQWQSFSNWCPGDVIDNRIIGLGSVKAGTHKIRISVPTAKFPGEQGDIPVSIYFHGATKGTETAGIRQPEASPERVSINIRNGVLTTTCDEQILGTEIYTMQGSLVCRHSGDSPINVDTIPNGIYFVNTDLADGIVETHKIMINGK